MPYKKEEILCKKCKTPLIFSTKEVDIPICMQCIYDKVVMNYEAIDMDIPNEYKVYEVILSTLRNKGMTLENKESVIKKKYGVWSHTHIAYKEIYYDKPKGQSKTAKWSRGKVSNYDKNILPKRIKELSSILPSQNIGENTPRNILINLCHNMSSIKNIRKPLRSDIRSIGIKRNRVVYIISHPDFGMAYGSSITALCKVNRFGMTALTSFILRRKENYLHNAGFISSIIPKEELPPEIITA